MCSRYELSTNARELARRFGLADAPPLPNAAEIRPTDQALVIASDAGRATARLLPWGLEAEWSTRPLINARAEILAEKRTFQPLLQQRCIVPASAYFEWRKDAKAKLKNRIGLATGEPFAIAGLIGEGRFTILTCDAAPGIAHIHDRMPVILDPAAEPLWLDADVAFADVRDVLRPYDQPLAADEEAPGAGARDLFSE